MNKDGLKFHLAWVGETDVAQPLTSATLTISVDGEAIWPVPNLVQVSLDIQADDLLSYLAEFWKPLLLRQTYPIGARPERPSLLRAEAERRWADQPTAVADREEESITAFEEAHDLSRCFAGQFDLPSIWFLREGERMIVETRRSQCALPFAAVRDALVDVGDRIAARFEATRDPRWFNLVQAWRARDEGDPSVLLAWSTGLDRDVARQFVSRGVLTAPTDMIEASSDDDELRIAARMANALPPAQIDQIIQLVKSFAGTDAPRLDDLGRRTIDYVGRHFAEHRPYEQGEAAANFVRQQFDLPDRQPVDIQALLTDLGTALHRKSVAPSTLDALAVWGPRHGPAILLNGTSIRLATKATPDRAARITLAHEFCHLLLDRGHPLSAVEVLDSRMPLSVERRAKAFAGELLLPGRVAAEFWFEADRPRSPEAMASLLKTLCRRFGVTKSVAAWKVEHGLHRHDIDLSILLNTVAQNR